jgi:histidine ammonia-lyase
MTRRSRSSPTPPRQPCSSLRCGISATEALPAVLIDEDPLRPAEIVAIADGATVRLGDVARNRIRASRATVDALVEGDELIYGLNTGLGHLRNERLSREALGAGQPATLRMHAGGFGPPLDTRIVRAAMAVRVAGIARGGSGASPAVAHVLVAMLNAGVHPVVPQVGSVGAGDLMHMAAIGLVAVGEGTAGVRGEVLPGAEALRRAGIEPIALAPKDALSLISANGVSIGHAALVVNRAARLSEAADLVLAVSLEAIRGNPSIVDPLVAAAKPVPGQAASARRVRAHLAGGDLFAPGGPASVQDPLSFRVGPQVHGAWRETVAFAEQAVSTELVAMDDNPLVVEGGRMLSNGNFHPMLMTLAVEALRPALAHVGQLSDRRTGYIWDRLVDDPKVLTSEGAGQLTRYGSPYLRYSGAAQAAALVASVAPASLGVGPLDQAVEDHATNAPFAVRRTDEALAFAEDVLVTELLTSAAVLGLLPNGVERVGEGTRRALEALEGRLAELGASPSGSEVAEAAKGLLFGALTDAPPSDAGEGQARPA